MAALDGNVVDHLRRLVERIERLEEGRRSLSGDIKEVYAEARGMGFDTKIIRQLVKERRMDFDNVREAEALLDTYRRALAGWEGTPLGEYSEAAQ